MSNKLILYKHTKTNNIFKLKEKRGEVFRCILLDDKLYPVLYTKEDEICKNGNSNTLIGTHKIKLINKDCLERISKKDALKVIKNESKSLFDI